MSEWQGFDQRKICPKCGDYQTRVAIKQRQSFSSPHVLLTLIRYIGVIIVLIIAPFLPSLLKSNVYLLGLFLMGFAGLIVFFAYQSYCGWGKTIDRQSREENRIGYNLRCRNCGHIWEMTIEEWETAGRKERENFINSPSHFPSSKGNLNESFERIEWKPPNPGRGIFIVIGFMGAGLIASLVVHGVIWAKVHPDNPYALIFNGIAAIFALFVYTGLVVLIKPKANKIVLILLILVALIGLALTALRFFLA